MKRTFHRKSVEQILRISTCHESQASLILCWVGGAPYLPSFLPPPPHPGCAHMTEWTLTFDSVSWSSFLVFQERLPLFPDPSCGLGTLTSPTLAGEGDKPWSFSL